MKNFIYIFLPWLFQLNHSFYVYDPKCLAEGVYSHIGQCDYCPKGEFCKNGKNETCPAFSFATLYSAVSSCELFGTKWEDYKYISRNVLPKSRSIGKIRINKLTSENCPVGWECPNPHTSRECVDGSKSSGGSICVSCGKGEACKEGIGIKDEGASIASKDYVKDNEWNECSEGYSCTNSHDMIRCEKYTISNHMNKSGECLIAGPNLIDIETTRCPYGTMIYENQCKECVNITKYCPDPYIGQISCPFTNPNCTTPKKPIYPSIGPNSLTQPTQDINIFLQVTNLSTNTTISDTIINFKKLEDIKYNILNYSISYAFTAQKCGGKPTTFMTLPFGYNTVDPESDNYHCNNGQLIPLYLLPLLPNYEHPCMAGTYSNYGFSYCMADYSGYHTYREEQPSSSFLQNTYCRSGYFCTRMLSFEHSISVSIPKQCPPGTYNILQGVVYEWQNCMECPSGYYCLGGNEIRKCPKGSICRKGAHSGSEISCGDGRMMESNEEGETTRSSCKGCKEGGYCKGGDIEERGECSQGYWCPAFTQHPQQYPLSRGKYQPSGTPPYIHYSQGLPCTIGAWCPLASTHLNLCPIGTYHPNYTQSLHANLECLLCPLAKYCSGENLEYVDDLILHTDCTENMYCPMATNAPLYPPPGTVPTSGKEYYQTSAHGFAFYMGTQNNCGERHQCTNGTIHPNQKVCKYGEKANEEKSGCKLCSDGEYCIGPTIQACPDYMYCIAGKAYDCPIGLKPNEEQDGFVHRTCPLGEEMGKESCEPCKIGGYCIENTRKKCDAGFYTPNIGGSKAEDCVRCELGSQCLENEIPESCPSSSICCGTYLEDLGIGINPEHCEEASRTKKCPDGYLCAGDSSVPRMCPHGKLAVGGNSCVDIRSGMFTGGGESEEDEGAGGGGPCAPGYYCDGGSKTEYNKACDTGFENSEEGGSSIESCTPCRNGRYCIRGNPSGLDCPLGHYCVNAELPTTEDIESANKEETLYPIKCEIGTYGESSILKDSSECSACEAGKACTEEGQENSGLDCEAGYYCSGKTKTTCPLHVDEDGNGGNICPPGGYCTAGVSLMTKCPEGKFNMFSGSRFPSDCQLCTPGTYCHQGAQTPTGLCSQGYYCPEGSETNNNKKSSGGHFSRMGSPGECNCLKGEYSGEGASSCIKCPSGFFCDRPETTDSSYKENICPAGRYCPEATTNAKYCGIGTYNGASGAESSLSCIKCESKKNCRDHGMKLPLDGCDAGYICLEGSYSSHPGLLSVLGEVIQYGPCISGYYCEENSSVGTKCGAGRYSTDELLTSSSECRECWNGYTCSGEGRKELPSELCEAGHTCERASKKECGKGHYCPEGSMYSTPCAPGHTTQSVVSPTCEQCAQGSFCPLIDRNLPPQISLCLPGYLCPAATFHHKQHPCPQGSYKLDDGGFDADNHCTPCTPGKYCLSLATQSLSNDNSELDTCRPGFYCLQGAKYGQPKEGELGGICNLGYYCPMNSAAMTKCPSAYYCDEEAMTHPPTAKCLKGHICLEAQAYGAPMNIYQHNDKGYICPQGMFCVGGETHVQCDIGTYNPLYGSTTLNYCLSCPIGSFCASLGLIIPKICSSGYYCPVNSTLNEDESQKCDVGKYCPAGTKQMISCPEGEYQDQTGQSECKSCSPGNICPFTNDGKTTQEISCPIGYMCPRKSMKAADSCLPGTYQDEEGKESCKTCDKGYYCEEHAMTQQRKCTQGFYCLTDGLKVPTAICPFGKMCPEGTADPLDCPATKFCSGTGLYKETGMCPAGFYCPKGTTDSHANMCEAGHWCATGKAEATKCVVHTYNNYEGSDIIEDCRECPRGFICPDEGMSTPVDPNICEGGYFCYVDEAGFHKDSCTKGYKCPAGVRNQIECLPGTYQDELQQITCKDCEEGNYCDYAANHDPIESMEICPLGYYCPAKTGNYENSPCLEGTYGATIGLKSRDECSDCEENYLCMKRGQESSTTYPCRTGYVCNQKTKYLRDATECPQNMFCLPGRSAEECDDHKYTHVDVITTEGESSIMGYLGGGGESDCLDCPPGYECSKHNIWTSCSPGYSCPGHGEPKSLCPAGSYCPGVNSESMGSSSESIIPNAGDKEGIRCPRGTFSGIGAKICSKCIEGKFCGGYMTTDTSLRDCPAMFSCPTDIECPSYLGIQWCQTLSHLVGSYKPLPCPKGTYRDHSISQCVSCQKGHWCWPSIDNNSNDQGKCKPGFICQGGAHNPTPFNIQQIHKHTDSDFNTYNGPTAIGHKSLSGSTVNIECPEGYFQNSAGGDACVQCPSGYKCPDTKTDAITDDMKCEEGKVCSLGTISGIVGESTVTICPEGFYCPKGTAFAKDCRDGMHTGSEGNGECEKVGSGKYRSLGVNGRRAAECKKKNTNCKEGSGFEPKCQFGTYGNSELSESCSACPAGRYCIDGTSNPECTAGYLCSGGAQSPAPSGLGGSQCPEGGYCLHGAPVESQCPCPCDGSDRTQKCCLIDIGSSPCPLSQLISCPITHYQPANLIKVNEFIYLVGREGGRQGLDCIPCAPGFHCHRTTTQPCPAGHYCPADSDLPVGCPRGTYLSTRGHKFKEDCIQCPEGHFCSGTGVHSLNNYECSKGHYCIEGMIFREIGCPAGKYLNRTKGSRSVDCVVCPPGYKCGLGTGDPESCEAGELCEEGSSTPSPCPGGYYCNKETEYQKRICPKNHYCPISTPTPIACKVGELCPEGSPLPIKCVAGYYSHNVSTGESSGVEVECRICEAGTFSEEGRWSRCEACTGGYVCGEGCRYRYPLIPSKQQGYICPPGTYCPQGSSFPLSCPQGTYNPHEGGSTLSACRLCPENTYNDQEGQRGCMVCGSSATSTEGSTDCTPLGLNRVYLKSDGSSRCKPKYECREGELEESSRKDCQPMVYKRLSAGEVRDYIGQPTTIHDCFLSCGVNGGRRSPVLGVCICTHTLPVEEICDRECISHKVTLTVGEKGILTITHGGATGTATGTGTQVDIENMNIDLKYMKECKLHSQCKMANVQITPLRITSKYGLPDILSQIYRERLLRNLAPLDHNSRILQEFSLESSAIPDPIICINEYDTVMFEIGDVDHYPVYLKDSLLNSNPAFDYGAFKILQTTFIAQKSAGETAYTKSFAFTFLHYGNYVFADAANSLNILFISVKREAERCPDDLAYIQTRTTDSMATLGFKLDQKLHLQSDLMLLIILVILFLILLLLLLFSLKYFVAISWEWKDKGIIHYRAKNNRFNFKKLKFLLSKKKDSGEYIESTDVRGTPHDVMSNRHTFVNFIEETETLHDIDHDFMSDEEDPAFLRAQEDLDLTIIDKILERYKRYKDFIKTEISPVGKRNSALLQEMTNIFTDTKFMLNHRFDIMIEESKIEVNPKRIWGCVIKEECDELEVIDRERHNIPHVKLNKELENKYRKLISKRKLEEAELKRSLQGGESLDNDAAPRGKNAGQMGINLEENVDEGGDIIKSSEDDILSDVNEEGSPSSPRGRKEKDKADIIKKLGVIDNLSDLERRQLIADYENDLLNIEGILNQERALQELDLRKMLKENRKRGKNLLDHNKEEKPKALGDNESTADMQTASIQKIEKQISEELETALAVINSKTANKIGKAKAELFHHTKANTEKQKTNMMKIHAEEWAKTVALIEEDRTKQENRLRKLMAKRKKREIAQVKRQLRSQIPKDQENDDLDESEYILEDDIQQIIDEEIEKLVLNDEYMAGSKQNSIIEQEKEKRNLIEKQTKELTEFSENIEATISQEVEKYGEMRETQILEQSKFNIRRLQEEKRKFNDKIIMTQDKNNRKKLLEIITEKEKEISNVIEVEKVAQENLLKEKIARRKLLKRSRIGVLEDKMKIEKLELNIRHMEERQIADSEDNLKNVLLIIQKLQNDMRLRVSQAQIQAVFVRMVGDKHGQEFSTLLARQFTELEEQLRISLKRGLDNKLLEKEGIKNKTQDRMQDLVAQKWKFEERELETRGKAIKVEEANELHEAYIKGNIQLKKDETRIRQNMEDKHSQEFIILKETQIKEKEEFMKKLFGLLHEEAKEFKNQLMSVREQKEKDRENRKKKIDLEKKVILEKYEREMQNRFHDYDELLVKQREAEQEIENKKGNIEKIIKERKLHHTLTLQNQRASINPNQQQLILDQYVQNWLELEDTMESEKSRQYYLMKEKKDKRTLQRQKQKITREKAVNKIINSDRKIFLETREENLDQFKENVSLETFNKLEQWKINIFEEEREQLYEEKIENNRHPKKIGRKIERVYLTEIQYRKYYKILEKVIALEDYLNNIRAIRAIGLLMGSKGNNNNNTSTKSSAGTIKGRDKLKMMMMMRKRKTQRKNDYLGEEEKDKNDIFTTDVVIGLINEEKSDIEGQDS